MRIKITVLILFFSIIVNAHPLHFSVTNIDFKNKETSISIKVFKNDIVQHLQLNKQKASNSDYFKNKHVQGIVNNYVTDKFEIEINGKKYKLTMKNIKIDADNMIINYTIAFNEQANVVSITNKILLDCFHDQKNLVVAKYKKTERGIELNNNTWTKSIKF